jgi:DMSO/TMAO reductase YedYZ molybdopterin-dependent catalytic subunit
MQKMRLSLLLTALLSGILLTSTALYSQQPAGFPVAINVTDPSGGAVQGARIRIVPTPAMAPKMESGADGRVSVNLQPGGYALFVEHPGFSTYVTHFDVGDSKEVQTVAVVLQAGNSGQAEPAPVARPAASPAVLRKDVLTVSVSPYEASKDFTDVDLRKFPPTTVTFHNSHSNTDEIYSGVRLSDLLSRMGVPLGDKLRGEALANYIVAKGADDYRVVLSVAEIEPSFHRGEIIVADSMNGKPLDEHSGPFKLVVTEDLLPARCVRNLVSLELRSAE